ncbi:MAG: hypothetical protein J7494_06225 [Sphingobium sp.]|nr:hypothetical protein [Sphingobium sp.]
MRTLLKLVAMLCLVTGLVAGSVVHAVETGSGGEVTTATQWLHADGDHDQVPADADGNYPHHHNACHGHDLGAPPKTCLPQLSASGEQAVAGVPVFILAAGPPHRLLRPPIA